MSPHARETRPFASEVKFVVDAAVGNHIREWTRRHMDPDPHGSGPFGDHYHTTSLYFDTDDGDVFHQRGSFGRSKYRVRRYGAAPAVFLERKLRKPGLLIKRRTIVDLETLERLATPDSDPRWPGDWFHQRVLLRQIKPVCLVSYARTARSAASIGGAMRVTLDEDVRAATALEPQFRKDHGVPVLQRHVIVELKYRNHMPALLKRLVEEFTLAPARASKYRLGVAALGEARFPLTRPEFSTGSDFTHV